MTDNVDNNLHLRKNCCNGCRYDDKYCIYRKELNAEIGKKIKINELICIKTCIYFKWD